MTAKKSTHNRFSNFETVSGISIICKNLNFLGILMMIGGLLGVMAFGVLGSTRSMPTALITHGTLFVAFVAFSIRRSGGLSAWRSVEVDGRLSVHPAIIVLFGSAFMTAGICIATVIQPGNEANSMTKADQVYLGSIFAMMGAGLSLLGIAGWITINRRKIR